MSDINDEILLELCQLYRMVEQRIKAEQRGECFDEQSSSEANHR